jgi:hypothetical protein
VGAESQTSELRGRRLAPIGAWDASPGPAILELGEFLEGFVALVCQALEFGAKAWHLILDRSCLCRPDVRQWSDPRSDRTGGGRET